MLDEFRSTNVTWDKATSRIYSPVTANESDENGRKLVVQIVNGGQVEDLTGASLHLYWETIDKRYEGLDAFKAVDLKKGEFELPYTTGMLSNQGLLKASLVLIDTVGRVVSERFKITVSEGIDDDAIQSEDSFSSLTQALIDISDLEQNYAPRLNDLTAQLQQAEYISDKISVVIPSNSEPDNTDDINGAIASAKSDGNNRVRLSAGQHRIRGHVSAYPQNYLRDVGGIELQDNLELELDPNSELKAIANGERQYVVLRIYDKEDVKVVGGKLIGERDQHTGTAGEWGYGVAITGGKDVVIKDVTSNDMYGDGFNIQVHREIEDGEGQTGLNIPENITIDNVRASNNLRQGMSIEAGKNIMVRDSVFENTKGKAPESGVDIEPWDAAHLAEYITFDNCAFRKNNGHGLLITRDGTKHVKVLNSLFEENVMEAINIEGQVADVVIERCNFIKGKRIRIRSAKTIKVSNCYFEGPAAQILDAEDVVFENCTFNPSSLNVAQPIVSFGEFVGGTTKNRDIKFINCNLKGYLDKTKPLTGAIQARLVSFEDVTNVKFINCSFDGANIGIDYIGTVGRADINGCEFYNIKSRVVKDIRNTTFEDNVIYGGNFGNLTSSTIYNEGQKNNIIRRNKLFRSKVTDKQLSASRFTGAFITEPSESTSVIEDNIEIG